MMKSLKKTVKKSLKKTMKKSLKKIELHGNQIWNHLHPPHPPSIEGNVL